MVEDTIRPTRSSIKKAAENAVIGCFADMLFLDVETADKDNDQNFIKTVLVDILLPWRGKILLYLPQTLVNNISKNIFNGDDGPASAEDTDDCLIELLNIICGNFLDELLGGDAVYRIGLPVVNYGLKPEECEDNRIYFDAEGDRFILTVDY